MVIRKSTILNLIFFLSFYPFFKFIPGISAEIQPLAEFLGLLSILVFAVRRDRVLSLTMLFFLTLAMYTALSLVFGRAPGSVVMLAGAYALPFFLLLAIKDNTHLLSTKVFHVAVLLYLIVGVLQSLSLLVWAQPYMQYLIPRFLGAPAGSAGRGVTFLAQEPSGAGFIISLMLATGVYFFLIGRKSGRQLVMIAAAVLLMLFMNRSGTAFLLLLSFSLVFLFMMFWYGSPSRKARILLLTVPAVPLTAAAVSFVITHYTKSARFLTLLHKLMALSGSNKLFTYSSLAVLSGGRFLTVLMGYVSLFDGYGLGHGIAAYQEDYSRLSSFANIKWASYAISTLYTSGMEQKPNAYAAQIAMDMGLSGLVIVILIVVFCWKQWRKDTFWLKETRLKKSLAAAVFATALLIIFFRSTTAIPVPWVMLAYVHDFIESGIRGRLTVAGEPVEGPNLS